MGDSSQKRLNRLRLAGLGGRTLGFIALCVLAIAAADKIDARWDLSPDRRYTLDPDLVRILSAQSTPVEMVAMWSRDAAPEYLDALQEGLTLMAAKNPQITLKRIDPVLQKPLYQRHRETFGDGAYPAIYLTHGDRAFKIPINGSTRHVLQREVGGGLLALADPKPPHARFLSGHGELSDGGGIDGIDAFVRSLHLAGFTTTIGSNDPIDPSSIVVVAGPIAALGTTVIEQLQQHLIDGGAMLVCADDRIPKDLALLLRRWGILIGPGIPLAYLQGDPNALLDPDAQPLPSMVVVSRARHAILQEAEFPYANVLLNQDLIRPHPATASVAEANREILSPWTTPVFPLNLDPENQELLKALAKRGALPAFAEPPLDLLRSAPQDSWMTLRSEPPKVPEHLEQMPPIPLCVAATYRPDPSSTRQGESPRLIVWGSRAAIANGILAQNQFANADVLVDMSRWLANRGKANPIPASETAAFQVQASDSGLTLITALLVAILPCLAIGGALLAWMHRR